MPKSTLGGSRENVLAYGGMWPSRTSGSTKLGPVHFARFKRRALAHRRLVAAWPARPTGAHAATDPVPQLHGIYVAPPLVRRFSRSLERL